MVPRGAADAVVQMGVAVQQDERKAMTDDEVNAYNALLAFAHSFLKSWAGPGSTDSPLEAEARAAIALAEAVVD